MTQKVDFIVYSINKKNSKLLSCLILGISALENMRHATDYVQMIHICS